MKRPPGRHLFSWKTWHAVDDVEALSGSALIGFGVSPGLLKSVLKIFIRYCDRKTGDGSRPSLSTIARHLSRHVRTVRLAVRVLEWLGLLERQSPSDIELSAANKTRWAPHEYRMGRAHRDGPRIGERMEQQAAPARPRHREPAPTEADAAAAQRAYRAEFMRAEGFEPRHQRKNTWQNAAVRIAKICAPGAPDAPRVWKNFFHEPGFRDGLLPQNLYPPHWLEPYLDKFARRFAAEDAARAARRAEHDAAAAAREHAAQPRSRLSIADGCASVASVLGRLASV